MFFASPNYSRCLRVVWACMYLCTIFCISFECESRRVPEVWSSQLRLRLNGFLCKSQWPVQRGLCLVWSKDVFFRNGPASGTTSILSSSGHETFRLNRQLSECLCFVHWVRFPLAISSPDWKPGKPLLSERQQCAEAAKVATRKRPTEQSYRDLEPKRALLFGLSCVGCWHTGCSCAGNTGQVPPQDSPSRPEVALFGC